MSDKNELPKKGHEGRQDLIGEHRWGDAGQLILFFLFIVIWITDSFFMKYSILSINPVSYYFRIPSAILILILSGILARKSMNIVFGEIRKKPEVIRKGVFSIVRHPMYLAAILLYLPFILWTFSMASFGLWLLIVLFYFIISKYEEKLLVQYIGDDYIAYMKEVPMWIPVRLK